MKLVDFSSIPTTGHLHYQMTGPAPFDLDEATKRAVDDMFSRMAEMKGKLLSDAETVAAALPEPHGPGWFFAKAFI